MKFKIPVTGFSLAILLCTVGASAQVKKTASRPQQTTKFGSLAIDRSNGFYYGFSFDAASLKNAEEVALSECKKRGGNCSIVLSYSGTGCAAYRTVDQSAGTAYGWGIARTKAEADGIATRECLKRSNGKSPANFVWSCNSDASGMLKEIYNANDEMISTVKIGNLLWADKNLNVGKFSNGDAILEVKNADEWQKANNEGTPAFAYAKFDKANGPKLGRMYNWHAVNDSRGLAPAGYRIPSRNDWQALADAVGGLSTLGGKLKSKTGWEKNNGSDDFGFNGIPAANFHNQTYGGAVSFWSSTERNEKYVYSLTLYSFTQEYEISSANKTAGYYVRVVAQ